MSRRRRRRRPVPVTDDVVRGCLDLFRRRGDMTTVGILADRMDELELPHAKTVRRMWNRFNRRFAYWTSTDLTRRSFTAREVIALDVAHVWRMIARLFGRKWKFPGLHKFM